MKNTAQKARVVQAIRLVCPECGKAFKKTRTVQIRCSRECYQNSRRGKPRPRSGPVADCLSCGKSFYSYPSRPQKFCSKQCNGVSQRGKILSPQTIAACQKSSHWKGKHLPLEVREKISATRIRRGLTSPTGAASPRWRGGVTKPMKLLRHRKVYRDWRKAVFERDDYTCQFCGIRGGYLNADHIKPFAYFPELRTELSNGRTLCVPCHRLTPTWGARAKTFA